MQEKPRVEWRAQARADLLTWVSYIADDNPDAAQKLKNSIESKIDKLPDHPKLYKRSSRAPGLRELIAHDNYIVLYRESPDVIEIVALVHARKL